MDIDGGFAACQFNPSLTNFPIRCTMTAKRGEPMNTASIRKILADTAYVRTGGSDEELRCAQYLVNYCQNLSLSAQIQTFPVPMYRTETAKLTVNGREIPCTAYGGTASGTFEGRIYYPESPDHPMCLKKCKGTIVLTEAALTYKRYDAFVKAGAVAVITCSGDIRDADPTPDRRELRFDRETELPAANIHISEGLKLAAKGGSAVLTLSQTQDEGQSRNVVLDLPGQSPEIVNVSAHYDSTALSLGSYDNMSGAIALLYLAEYFKDRPHRRTIRLLWCGSEERGLLGAIAHCGLTDQSNTVLNINLDMLGSVMGSFAAFSCIDEAMKDHLEAFLKRCRVAGSARYAIRSTDSNAFLYVGVPAVTFARYAPGGTAPIHTACDVPAAVCPKNLLTDAKFTAQFTQWAADTDDRWTVSDKIQQDVTEYMARKTAVRVFLDRKEEQV